MRGDQPDKTMKASSMRQIFKIGGILLINLLLIAGLLEVGLRVTATRLPPLLAAAAQRVVTGEPYAADWQPAWQHVGGHYYALKPNITNALQYGSPTVSFRLSTVELWKNGGIGFRTAPVDFFVDAVVVGDSFGMCFTEQADCWVEQIGGKFHPPLNIVNLSQPVTGTTSHGRILQDFGSPYTPPLVIWQFFGNDFNDDYGLMVFDEVIEPLPHADELPPDPTPPLQRWLRQHSAAYNVLETALTGQLRGTQDSDRAFLKPYNVLIGQERLWFGALYEQRALDMSLPQNQLGLGYSRTAFTAAQALVNSWGGQMVVVIIPTREEVYAAYTESIMGTAALNQIRSARTAMLELCTELDLACFDPLPAFQARAQNQELLYYLDDMHLNPYGNAILAAELSAWLAERGFVTQQKVF
jgi:hypothetical protein